MKSAILYAKCHCFLVRSSLSGRPDSLLWDDWGVSTAIIKASEGKSVRPARESGCGDIDWMQYVIPIAPVGGAREVQSSMSDQSLATSEDAQVGCARTLRAAVIGAGMGGILAAIKLRERGINTVVFEKGDGFGGTWRENSYPGLACDVAAHWYTYTFARNPNWKSLMAEGADIRDYFSRVAEEFGVDTVTRFNEEVVSLEYRDRDWSLETSSGHRARIRSRDCCNGRSASSKHSFILGD